MSCAHPAACLSWLPDLGMWRLGCPDPPDGLAPLSCVAYGVTVEDAYRVFGQRAPGFAPGRFR